MIYPWSDFEVAELRRLWDEGHQVKIIAYKLGRSVNSVARKRKDIKLPIRRSLKTSQGVTRSFYLSHAEMAFIQSSPLPRNTNLRRIIQEAMARAANNKGT